MKFREGIGLIEIVVAVGLLALLGGILAPQYQSLLEQTQEEQLKTDLSALREALEQFREQHPGVTPGVEGREPRPDLLVQQLTRRTRADGTIDPNGEFGPYLKGGIPPNPLNGKSSVLIDVADSQGPGPNGATGWLLHVRSQTIIANALRETASGQMAYEF